jgi:hypothetical protein
MSSEYEKQLEQQNEQLLKQLESTIIELEQIKEKYIPKCVVSANSTKEWRLNGKRHREDGPAVEWTDGSKQWWIHGEQLTEEAFNELRKTT